MYPGCTEEDCIPVLETVSGLKAGVDFFVGYSPERINPGDKSHRFETILKVVSGQCPQTLDLIAQTYGAVVKAGIYKAQSIKVAEAAKVIENTQRDLNIAFVNELSKIFKKMNIDTFDVISAADTNGILVTLNPASLEDIALVLTRIISLARRKGLEQVQRLSYQGGKQITIMQSS